MGNARIAAFGGSENIHVTTLQLVVLAVVQGITEFLPISSEGHLIITSQVLGWPDQGLAIDLATNAGTLAAVIVFFWRDLIALLVGLGERGAQSTRPLVGMLIVATIPAGLAGLALDSTIGQEALRHTWIIATTTIVFGIVLWLADRFGMTVRRVEHMTWGSAIVIGLAQVLALIPGTSRSGITMSAARVMGFEREAAARFSLLMAIPLISAAVLLGVLKIRDAGDAALTGSAVLVAGIAFVTALVALAAMMAWLRRASFTPFVIYRLLLGAGLLAWLYA